MAEYTKASTTIKTTMATTGIMCFLLGRTWIVRLSDRFDDHDEPIASDHLDACAGLQRAGGASAPNLAPDPNPPLGSLPEDRFAFSSKQRLGAGHDGPVPRAQQEGENQQEEGRRCGRNASKEWQGQA